MTVHEDTGIDVPAEDDTREAERNDRRLWIVAKAAFLDRYSRTPNMMPEEVAEWAVEGAVALCNEFRRQAEKTERK